MVDSEGWRAIFGHDEPYDVQADGIETAVETARDGGFTVIEGACGTGKTMLALTAGLHLVRDPSSPYERVVVLTSVRQQLRQFEDDLRTINDGLPEEWRPVSGVTLVGKADVCPYSREGAAGIDESNVYERCDGLRERTRTLADDASPGALAADARSQQVGLSEGGSAATYLETAGEMAPYDRETPERDGVEYCPFYAGYLEDLPENGSPAAAIPFDLTDAGMIDAEEVVARSVAHGTCPHSMLGAILSTAEVVIGNYYHAFDPVTVGGFTGGLLDESTFVICDEAHMLEPRVRELVSVGVGDTTLRDAETELTRVIQPVRFDDGARTDAGTEADADRIRAELADADLTVDDVEEVRDFVRDLREEVDRRVTTHLDREHPGWRADPTDLPDEELPLRDPESPEPDALSEWAKREGHRGVWIAAETVGAVTARILDELDEEDRERSVPVAGRVLAEWYRRGHERHFREIVLERTWDGTEPANSWRRAYNARLSIHNCVPGDAIGERLSAFGGGVLMSATLEPIDVFEEVTGLRALADDGRPIARRTYGLAFPEENRASFAVDAPKFTYDNRGPPGEETPTRRAHLDATAAVAAVPGNVLVGMPSYAEAEWMADALDERIEKPILLDESSGDDATEALKGEFFAGDGKVLVTSLRGTLTEGVDYRGDRLHAAVVCGVPIVDTSSPRTKAVRTAYEREFGNGFEYALLVPAVRKARQAIGRVIRGPDETGVRVFVDERYARDSWDSVRGYFPDDGAEFQPVSPDMLSLGIERFRRRRA